MLKSAVLIDSRMSETVREIRKLVSICESDILDSELRIWIGFFQSQIDIPDVVNEVYTITLL